MPDMTIRGLPDELHAWLKEQAEAHHRSLNGEAIALLEKVRKGMPSPRPKLSAEEIMARAERFARLPVVDARSPDEIAAYDDNGLPR